MSFLVSALYKFTAVRISRKFWL